MIKALQGAGPNGGKELARQVDSELIELLMPELRDCRSPLDAVRRQTAMEIVYKWHRDLIRTWAAATEEELKKGQRDREQLQTLKTELEAVNIKLQETQGDLTAAKAGRGLYEDKARAELQRKLAAKELLLEQAAQLEQTQNDTIASLQAELRGRAAATQSYEISISQLTTAAAAAAEQVRKDRNTMDALIKDARAALSNARDNIQDRWGNDLTPFMLAIRNDIVTALTKLPPSA